jgi:hypothetical protein
MEFFRQAEMISRLGVAASALESASAGRNYFQRKKAKRNDSFRSAL